VGTLRSSTSTGGESVAFGGVLLDMTGTGFLNMIGEGMSCALHSGAITGEAIIDATLRNRKLQPLYRSMISSEARRTNDQRNPLKIAFGRPHKADLQAALMALPMKQRLLVLRNMWRFICLYKEFKWGREIMRESLARIKHGHYPGFRWL